MRLLVLTAIAMVAFAGNSLLNRAAVGGGHIDPMLFAALRVAAGALVLAALTLVRGRTLAWAGHGRFWAVAGLAAYMLGFSSAYLALDAGTGALVLFATVQITMFAGALAAAEPVPPARWIGAVMAMAGLGMLLWPGSGAIPAAGPALAMVLAGVGWGVYSLTGRKAANPLSATAANFVLCLPVVLLPLPWAGMQADPTGVLLAIVSGAVTSGLGYALWFAVVPHLGAARAAVAQLSVPVIALAGGAVLLAESPAPTLLLAASVTLGGVALAMRR